MPKIAILGPQGAGKTTIAMLFARVIQKMDSRTKIYTNVTNIDEMDKTIVTISDLVDIPFQDGLPKIVLVDEAYFSVGSRSSNSKQNIVWTKAFALFRKSDVVLTMFVTHRHNMIDVNIRDVLDFVIMGRKSKENFDYLIYETISKQSTSLQLSKVKELFDFTKFDTKDFPNTITVTELMKDPLFNTIK